MNPSSVYLDSELLAVLGVTDAERFFKLKPLQGQLIASAATVF